MVPCRSSRCMEPTIHPYLKPLQRLFESEADERIAIGQRAYMKGNFDFYGIKTPHRRQLIRVFLEEHGRPAHDLMAAICRSAWDQPQREFQYTAMELFTHAAKTHGPQELLLAEELILRKSWWDTVDHLAVHGVGKILLHNRGSMVATNRHYMESGQLWLQRTALIFQLRYKEGTDRKLLFDNVRKLADHKDFFIRKAIGWALRQYAYVDKHAVIGLLRTVELSPLSVREALKHA